MKPELIAPCGMNCALCRAYQFYQGDLNQHGFHRKYCPGCRPRWQGCLHMKDSCTLLGNNEVEFCFECPDYPCKRLKSLDQRYKTKYHMSMIVNLDLMKEAGMEAFLNQQAQDWTCPDCGGLICCHHGLCLSCDLEVLMKNKGYRWDKDVAKSDNKYSKDK